MGEAALVNRAAGIPVVRIRQLSKRYGTQPALKGIDLNIHPGEIYGLVGPDGAGKSTLMHALAGVLAFDSGELEVLGVQIDSKAAAESLRARMGFMPQGIGQHLSADLSIEENLDFFAHLRLVPEPELSERKERLLGITRLQALRSHPVKQLSAGMKQRLGLCCALIHDPELLLLDEPTRGLDPAARQDFWSILTGWLCERGASVLVSTACLDEAGRCHRLALCSQGEVLACGAPSALLGLAPGTRVRIKVWPALEAWARLHTQFPDTWTIARQVHLFAPGMSADEASARIEELLSGMPIQGQAFLEPELEDVFVSLLRRHGHEQGVPGAAWPRSEPRHAGTAIEARELVCDFGGFRALDHVSLQVGRGEIVGLAGPNGAGKSTLIKLLAGILKPSTGESRISGHSLGKGGREVKQLIGYVPQGPTLYPELGVLQSLRLFAGIYGLGRAETSKRIAEIIEILGLQGYMQAPPRTIHPGARRRLALGCALLHRPCVLFLDEPTCGVGPLCRRGLWDLLVGLSRDEGVAILVATHDTAELERCDRVALLHEGRLLGQAAPEEWQHQFGLERGQLVELWTDEPTRALALIEQSELAGAALWGQSIRLFSGNPDGDQQRIRDLLAANGISAMAISARPPSMQEVLIERMASLRHEGSLSGQRPTADRAQY